MTKQVTKDPRPLYARLWTFQRERAPLYGVIIMASLTLGVVYQFSEQPLRYYVVSACILALYLIQIRTADEKKDFEHDNKYHPDRPVQRGVVSLSELALINKLSIVTQLLLYASFLSLPIMLLGLLSQGYAYLTKREFFVREWIRRHFYIYYFSHYIQLVILFYSLSYILQPVGVSKWLFVLFFMLCVIVTEIGRKMFAEEDDTIDDTYSAQLGHGGSALALVLIAVLINAVIWYFLAKFSARYIYIVVPIVVLGIIANYAYHYAQNPDKRNADAVERMSGLLYVVAMLTVILGV